MTASTEYRRDPSDCLFGGGHAWTRESVELLRCAACGSTTAADDARAVGGLSTPETEKEA